MLTLAAVLLAQATAAAPPPAPSPSGPPTPQIDCAAGGKRSSVWERARAPHGSRYCDFMAHAEARMPQEPRRAEQSAAAAAALLPEQAAPWVVQARASVAQGKYAEGKQRFERALALDAGALRDARAQHDWAVALREVGETARAIAAYQALLPRVDALPDEEQRTLAQIDGATALMLLGPERLDAAVAVLRSAAAGGAPSRRALARAALALALDRAGSKAEAAAAAAEAHKAGALAELTRAGGLPALGWQVEGLAVQARLREASDGAAAAALWETYLGRAGQGPWAAHAREHQGASKRAPRKGAR